MKYFNQSIVSVLKSILHACIICFLFSSVNAQSSEKKALLIGIGNYPESGHWPQINSANDIVIIKAALINQGFKEENILTLTEADATKKNILEEINTVWFNKLKPTDIAYFHFSGHGQQMADQDGDEIDGLDECIVPYDSPKDFKAGVYEGDKLITDDEIRDAFIKIRQKLGDHGHLIVVLDACHSGTGTRGNPLARGTTEIMASKSFLEANSQRITTKENDKMNNDMAANSTKLAPMVSFFGSAQNQLNYEYTNDKGEHYGSLSFAMSKLLSQTKPDESYRGLFDKIKVEMSTIAPMQQPQAEGDLDMEVLDGKALGNASYYNVTKFSGSQEATIDAGFLHGLFEGSKIGFYPPDTRDFSSVKPIAVGEVESCGPSTCPVKISGEYNEDSLKNAWAYVTDKSFGSISVPIQLNIKDTDLLQDVTAKLSAYPYIQVGGTNPRLIIDEKSNSRGASKAVNMSTAEGFSLGEFDFTNKESDFNQLAKDIKNFAQGMFLRKLELQGNYIKLQLEILKFTPAKGDKKSSLAPFQLDETGNMRIQTGDIIQVKIKNLGIKPAYFNLIDIQPDNNFKVILPESPQTSEEMKVLGEQEIILPNQWNIGEPFGPEIFKLVGSDKPLNLGNAFGTRGSVNQSPFEKLFSETYSDDFLHTRGTNKVNLSSSDIDIFTTSFLIVK